MHDDVQGFLSNLPKWSRFFEGIQLPAVMAETATLDELQLRLGNIRRRLRDGPDAPLRIAFFGPTGAGKSKLFGSLIGNNCSRSGFKRPFTRRSFYYLHDDWKPLAASLQGEVSLHQDPEWLETILVDTPDFDSVESENRREAERVFLESDGFLFVTDALKYADASTWEYLQRIHQAGKVFAVILNKVKSDAVSDGFRERFERTLCGGKPADYLQVEVPEFRINDDTLIAKSEPSMQQLQDVTRRLVCGDQSRQSAAVELLRGECQAFSNHADQLLTEVRSRRQAVEKAVDSLRQRAEASKRRLDQRLHSGLEPDVREDVYQDVLKRLEKIDVLSYPRKILAMPVQGLRKLVTGWLPQTPDPTPTNTQPAFADPISSQTFHLLESELIAFADQSRNDISRREGLSKLIDRDTFKSLRFDHQELQQCYIQHHQHLSDWISSRATATAAEITGENKTKFVLSQVLFNTVLLSCQVATGGLSPLELAADGVLSPMVAKGVSMMIGSEKVRQFEAEAHAEHQRSLASLVDQACQRFEDYLRQACAGLEPLQQQLQEITASRGVHAALLDHFQQQGRPQQTAAKESRAETAGKTPSEVPTTQPEAPVPSASQGTDSGLHDTLPPESMPSDTQPPTPEHP